MVDNCKSVERKKGNEESNERKEGRKEGRKKEKKEERKKIKGRKQNIQKMGICIKGMNIT